MGTGAGPSGTYVLQSVALGQIQELTLISEFLNGPPLVGPIANSQVPTNTGDNGVPTIFRWRDIPQVDQWLFAIGLDPELDDATVFGDAPGEELTTNLITIDDGDFPLVPGQTYYWRTRAGSVDDMDDVGLGVDENEFESPWSETRSLSVSTTSTQVFIPQPNLPLQGSQLPGLGTTLSWNNPPGVTQVQVQITPLNGDGPAINLIIGSPIAQYVVPASVMGVGPYVMLPGATYTWRVRVTSSADPNITETDPSWGPWSEPRTFTTRRPDSGTIQLVSPINGQTVNDTTPTLVWKNAAADEFYYEVQLSADQNFNTDPRSATAAVFWNLIHAGQSNPPDSWTVPDANALAPGTYYWRIRQRLQATPAGAAEVGVAWTPAQRFVVQ
jgi:hypothetical protein